MIEKSVAGETNDDPRKLRSLLSRASDLARNHEVRSVVVGLCANRGDRRFREFIDFLQASLRVEDALFRMTRERTVLHLADVDRQMAGDVLERLRCDFQSGAPEVDDVHFDATFIEVDSATDELTVKDVLTSLFAPPASAVLH